MLAHKGNKSEEAERVINFLKSHEWGCMILDEVRPIDAELDQISGSWPSLVVLKLTTARASVRFKRCRRKSFGGC